MHLLVYIKLAVFICSAIAMLEWVVTLAGEIGSVITQGLTIQPAEKSWAILRCFFLGLASSVTLTTVDDFQDLLKS
jgi:NCS1 family nucleobase:cation symporter-1